MYLANDEINKSTKEHKTTDYDASGRVNNFCISRKQT